MHRRVICNLGKDACAVSMRPDLGMAEVRVLSIAMIGGTYEPEILDRMSARYSSGVDVPACVLQWKMIEGLRTQQQIRTHLINERRLPVFPIGAPMFVPAAEWRCEVVSSARHFAFLNLPGLKRLSKAVGVFAELLRWHRDEDDGERLHLVYSLHTPYLLASTVVGAMKGTRQFLVVPDLPRYMDLRKRGPLRRILKWVDSALQSILLRHVDGFILLSHHVAEFYGIPRSRFIVMEGIADFAVNRPAEAQGSVSQDFILYSGALSERYGIGKLIEAFTACDDVGELWICGDGEARGLVEHACALNQKIRYLGRLPREQVLELQRRAALLVNPRGSEDVFTRYSFPSKTMEYMQSGTPLLMAGLQGVPGEYSAHYWRVPDDTVAGWTAGITEAMNRPHSERVRFGQRAQEFVDTHKNPQAQMARVVEFISAQCTPDASGIDAGE